MSIIKKGNFIRKTICEKQFKFDSLVDEGKKFITEEVYNTMMATLKDVDLSKVIEVQDNTNFADSAACGGGNCEIVQLFRNALLDLLIIYK